MFLTPFHFYDNGDTNFSRFPRDQYLAVLPYVLIFERILRNI